MSELTDLITDLLIDGRTAAVVEVVRVSSNIVARLTDENLAIQNEVEVDLGTADSIGLLELVESPRIRALAKALVRTQSLSPKPIDDDRSRMDRAASDLRRLIGAESAVPVRIRRERRVKKAIQAFINRSHNASSLAKELGCTERQARNTISQLKRQKQIEPGCHRGEYKLPKASP